MTNEPKFTSRVWVVPNNSTVSDTVLALAEVLNRDGYKVISHSVFVHPNHPSSARVSMLGQLKKVK